MTPIPWLPFFLQTSDALFPTGAYAHSLGFEEIVRLGVVSDESTLSDFLSQQTLPGLKHLELPYLRYCHNTTDPNDLLVLDHEISAWKIAREAREASIKLGIRRLAALQCIHRDPVLETYAEAVRDGSAVGHHLLIYALQARIENIPLAAALTGYAYQSLAACCSTALKLIRIGQDGSQRVLRTASQQIYTSVTDSLAVLRDDAGCFNPLLEIASMRHEFASERMFIS